MAWNKVVHKAGIAVCVGSAFMASVPTWANNSSPARIEAARVLVEEYRELRRSCADQTGEERKSCVHELRVSGEQYRLAKQQLGLGVTEDPENIHLVTF